MNPNKTPWHDALESHMQAKKVLDVLLRAGVQDVGWIVSTSWETDQKLIDAATVFAWTEETMETVLEASRSIPLDTPLKWNLETLAVWWWFEKPLPFQTLLRDGPGVRILTFGWLASGEVCDHTMPVVSWLDDPVGREYIDGAVFPFGLQPSQTWRWKLNMDLGAMLERTRKAHREIYGPGGRFAEAPHVPEEAFMEATEGMARFILAALAWMRQKILLPEAPAVERHARKRYERAFPEKSAASVRIIRLRKAEAAAPRDLDETERSRVEWSVRWVVCGHWRNQPCGPGSLDRKLTWIDPFPKGPADKPLKAASRKVFFVDR